MTARMKNPAMVLPDVVKGVNTIYKAIHSGGVPHETLELVHLRASQINGCSVCVEMHSRSLKAAGESDERIWSVGAWRETPHYDEAERAALAVTEAATRLCDRSDPVPDEVWDEVTKHFDETQLAGLMLSIAQINVWNRLNASTRQMAGTAW
jgi:AhpD family alkylhydroperoxidase